MPSVPVVLDKRNRPEPHSGAVKVLMRPMYGLPTGLGIINGGKGKGF